MPAEGVRIVQMQTAPMTDHSTPVSELDDYLSFRKAGEVDRIVAENLLAQAFADGYEIANVAVGGNDRVLLTVWTLKLVVTLPKRTIPEIQPTAIRSTRL